MKCTESIMKWQVEHSHFLSHLRSSKVKFLQADYVATLELVHLVAFGTEQGFIGQDELQVRSRSDVIMSAQLGVIALRHLSHTLLERFTHFHHPENNAKQTMWAFIFEYYHLLKVIKSGLWPHSILMLSSRSRSSRNLLATISRASLGQAWNQSIVQQLIRDGNILRRLRKPSPIGLIAIETNMHTVYK